MYSFLGDTRSLNTVGPERLLIETVLKPDALIDAARLSGVRNPAAVTHVPECVRWAGAITWMRAFVGFLQDQIPYSP